MRTYTLEEIIRPYQKYPKVIQNAILLAHTHPAFLSLTKATRKVLYALLTRASQHDGMQPVKARIDRLAMEADVSDKTVQRALAAFREIGWVQQAERRSIYGLYVARTYCFSPALCELVQLPIKGKKEEAGQPKTKMSDGAVYVDLTFKEDQRRISEKKHKGKPVDLPPALQQASQQFVIRPTGVAKLRGIAHAAGHQLEHIVAVASQYLTRAHITGHRAYCYLERMATKPLYLVDYAGRALQCQRMATEHATASQTQTLADRCRNKRFVGPAGLVVRVFDGTAELVQDGVFTTIPYTDLPQIYAMVQAGTLKEAEPGMPVSCEAVPGASVQPYPAKVAQCPETASHHESKATPPGKVATSISCAKSHLVRLRSLVGLTREAIINDGPKYSQGARGMLGWDSTTTECHLT